MEWFLSIIVIAGVGNGVLKYKNEKPMSFEECVKSAKTFKSDIAKGGDAESGIAAVCTKGKLEYVR